jgi:hypothetical protein
MAARVFAAALRRNHAQYSPFQGCNLFLYVFMIMFLAGRIVYAQSLALSETMRSLATQQPECADFILPLWARAQGAPAPIWVEVTPAFIPAVHLMGYPQHRPHGQSADRKQHIRRLAPQHPEQWSSSNATTALSSSRERNALQTSSWSTWDVAAQPKRQLSAQRASQCITEITALLQIEDLPASHSIARQAKKCIFW